MEDYSSPMASLEAILYRKIDAYEVQDIMVLDVPNTSIQKNMPLNKYGE